MIHSRPKSILLKFLKLFRSPSIFLILFVTQFTWSQEKEIDAAIPTNLYTKLVSQMFYTSKSNGDITGLQFDINYTPDPDNLILAELPIGYNNESKVFGIMDMRIRYFTAIERNISSSFIAIAPFLDVTIPTGSFEDGLGTSTWNFSIGSVFGFIITDGVAIFPGVGYVHTSKPTTDLIPDSSKKAGNGFAIQSNISISFSKSLFMFLNPVYTSLIYNSEYKDSWVIESTLNYMIIQNEMQLTAGYIGSTSDVHKFKLGATLYF